MKTPILMLGAGRMGGAMIEGWLRVGAVRPAELILRDPQPGSTALAAQTAGALLNPPTGDLVRARTVVLAVKPQLWRNVAAEVSKALAPDAVIVSIAAGVHSADIAQAFGGRAVARVMPTTAVAISQGTASVFAETPMARAEARALFEPLGVVVDLVDEALMHAATAVSGSAPAYLYAFIEALEAAGAAAGLSKSQAEQLARSTLTGAAALLASSGEDPAELRRQVTSPGGTTQAALDVLLAEHGLPSLLRDAIGAAMLRSKELGG